MMMRTLRAPILIALAAFPTSAVADPPGLHLGWCIGVGNQHHSAACAGGGSGPATGITPDMVPTANPQTGTGPSTGPTPGGLPANIRVDPLPQEVITGTGQVPVIVGEPGTTITGYSLPPIIIVPNPPTILTGTSPVPQVQAIPTPSFTGTGQPVITIQPLPPTTFTGTTPQTTIQGTPSPSITGQSPLQITVYPEPQQTLVGYGPVSATVLISPVQAPSFSGISRVPGQVPQAIPQPTGGQIPPIVPASLPFPPTPGQVPQATPGQTPQPTPVLVPRPRPRPDTLTITTTGGGTITHRPVPQNPPVGTTLVSPQTGRAAPHDPPTFAGGNGARNLECLASGHGQRRINSGGAVTTTGALRHVGAVDVLGRDLPALHPDHADCIISVRRRGDD